MPRWFPAAALLALACAGSADAAGLLVPTDPGVTPLAMLDHHVTVAIDEQVAVTRVEQTFRNHTSRDLEATYLFPVPKGASVDRFSMWIGGKEVKGELVEAKQAREIYTDVVRRMQDPGLLEYAGNDLLKLRVYPVPANGTQKVAVRFTAINEQDSGLVAYTYPLRAEGKASKTERDFRIDVTVRSARSVQSVYSPTHPVTVKATGDDRADVHFEQKQGELAHDFQLYYALGKGDVGLSGLTHRPVAGLPGHVLFLISPRADLVKTQEVARDFVFVMDTSGSMAGVKMEQARKALSYCIDRLGAKDRFAVLNFATVVGQFRHGLADADASTREEARRWVRELTPTGGTAIDPALKAALDLRPKDEGRPFTVVFFTDGMPTVGEANPERILKGVTQRYTSHTRLFTFGVGDDVSTTLLDGLADATRAVSTYVRPSEDVEAKVSALYAKISHPVMTDLRLTVGSGVRLTETYPPKLPDLFHGGQVVVLAKYTGVGAATVELTGRVGGEAKKLTYELTFPQRTCDGRAFVEGLWARRKVGYLLDEIRRNGEKAELKDEVMTLARKHGIATPYTSYLLVPDVAATPPRAPVAAAPGAGRLLASGMASPGFYTSDASLGVPPPVSAPSGGMILGGVPSPVAATAPLAPRYAPAEYHAGTTRQSDNDPLQAALSNGRANAGKLGVDLAVTLDGLRNSATAGEKKTCSAAGRKCREVNGVWVDEAYDAKTPAVRVKAFGEAYFALLAKEPRLSEAFKLGVRVVWVTPSGTALVIDPDEGKATMTAGEVEALFRAK